MTKLIPRDYADIKNRRHPARSSTTATGPSGRRFSKTSGASSSSATKPTRPSRRRATPRRSTSAALRRRSTWGTWRASSAAATPCSSPATPAATTAPVLHQVPIGTRPGAQHVPRRGRARAAPSCRERPRHEEDAHGVHGHGVSHGRRAARRRRRLEARRASAGGSRRPQREHPRRDAALARRVPPRRRPRRDGTRGASARHPARRASLHLPRPFPIGLHRAIHRGDGRHGRLRRRNRSRQSLQGQLRFLGDALDHQPRADRLHPHAARPRRRHRVGHRAFPAAPTP